MKYNKSISLAPPAPDSLHQIKGVRALFCDRPLFIQYLPVFALKNCYTIVCPT